MIMAVSPIRGGGNGHAVLPPPLDAVPPPLWVPDRSDMWWWGVLPAVILAVVVGVHFAAPEFYVAHILPEGFGFLELTQFLLAGGAALLCASLLRYDVVKGSRLLWFAILFFALAAFYIAGEEHSWGQHFFNWGTPGYWAEINRQQETNLHNTSAWFNQRPKLLFEAAMFVGGVIVPLVQRRTGPFRQPLLALLTPPLVIALPALIALVFKGVDDLEKDYLQVTLFTRPSEVVETFQYLYMFFYVVVLRRRVQALDAAGVRHVAL
jgi:hypothetical protein